MRVVAILLSLAFILLPYLAYGAAIDILVTPAGPGSAEPFIFAGKTSVLLSWLEPIQNTDRVALRFARLQNGKWSAPRTIAERSDFFVNWADFPSVVEDARGVLFAHWLQKSGTDVYAYDVRMATSKDGGDTWGKPFLLNRDGRRAEHGFVSLVPLTNGGIAATWLDGRNMVEGKEEGEMSIRYATVDADGRIRSDVQLDSRTCECCTTGMSNSSGGPIVVYRDRSADETRDIAFVRRSLNNSWTKPALLHRDGWKIAGCPVNGPQIDAIGKRVGVAWFTAAKERQRVYASFSSDGGVTFREPLVVDDGRPVGRVDIVLLESGDAVVTWLEQTTTGAEIRSRVLTRNLSVQPSIKIADSAVARGAGFPRTARLNGEMYVAWTEQKSSSDKRVRLARLRF